MVRIRLRRVGKKGKAYYRVVVAEHLAPRDGAFIELLGSYNPHAEPPTAQLNDERTRRWIEHGAKPTESVERILKRHGILDEAGKLTPEPAATAATSES